MSDLIETYIKPVQRKLGVEVDGIAGDNTWHAIAVKVGVFEQPVKTQTIPIVSVPGIMVDDRSESNIKELHPVVQPIARQVIWNAVKEGINAKVISGFRSYEQQNALYEKGRSQPGKVVTNAKGGYSNHNFGLAFDIGIFAGAFYKPEGPEYRQVGKIGKTLGLAWGGDWMSFRDEPHLEYIPSWAKNMTERERLEELRRRKAAGESLV